MGDLDKLIAAKGFKKLPKVQPIAQSGHTDGIDYSDIRLMSSILPNRFTSSIFYILETSILLKYLIIVPGINVSP